MKYYALIGAPGVGKGTFATIISKKLNLKHISVGDIIRNEIKLETKQGKEFMKYVNKGILVPDEIICNLVFNEINNSNKILLDGFPRYLIKKYFHLLLLIL